MMPMKNYSSPKWNIPMLLMLLFTGMARQSAAQCSLSTHTNFTTFSVPSGSTPASLWLNLHTKLTGQLTANGDYLLFTGGTVTMYRIVSTPTYTDAAVPAGMIIADNTVSSPQTSYNGTMWITRVPLGYSNTDIFISGGIYNSSNSFNVQSGKYVQVKGYWYSNKSALTTTWTYGYAIYRPQFSMNDISGTNQVYPMLNGSFKAGTPYSVRTSLISGGSGTGGTNYTGTYAANDNVTACVCTVPSPGANSGNTNVCVSATTTLSNATSGGTWSSSNTSVATVNASGIVTGVAAGSATITYTVTNACGTGTSTSLITVASVPVVAAVTGTNTVCSSSTTQLSCATAGGTWSSSNTSVATVNTSGLVTGVASGTAVIFYSVSNTCSTSVSSATVTVTAAPVLAAISGDNALCISETTQFSNTTSGGTWSSSNTSVATVSTNGLVTAVASGSATITYALTNSCGSSSVNRVVTVGTLPVVAEITSASNFVCTGSTLSLSNVTSGGTWSSSNTARATVNSSGLVTGVSTGGVTISYAVIGSCGTTTVTKGLTVNGAPTVEPVTGSNTVYTNYTTQLSCATANGAWSSSDTLVAVVSNTGLVSGVGPGNAGIIYSVTNSCGTTPSQLTLTVSTLAPSCVNDTARTQYSVPVNVDVLANDDGGSYALRANSVALVPASVPNANTVGTFQVNNDGSITFTPVSTFDGLATVQYTAINMNNQSSGATLVVRVSGPCSVDADSDGVPDCLDEYMNDQYRAFRNSYPAAGYSTLMFEDNWPWRGDYDFNDVVLDYRWTSVTDASNNVVEMDYTFVLRCSGAGLHNGFGFQLDGVAPNKIRSVTGVKTNGAAWVQTNSNGTESGQTYANIIVFNNAYDLMPYPGSGHFVNTDPDAPKVPYDTIRIRVQYMENGTGGAGGTVSLSELSSAYFNPYLVLGDTGGFEQNRTKEVHLPDRAPTSKMNQSLFGKGNDNSNAGQGRFFRTAENLPWALNIATSIPYMKEYEDISDGYLKFIDWASGNGSTNNDWYHELSGHRNNNKLYLK